MNIENISITDDEGRVLGTDCRALFEGEICPYVTVESPIGKQVIGYEIIKKDLSACVGILDSIKNEVTDVPLLLNALWESYITKYGRCFADASKGRGVKLEAKDVFPEGDTNFEDGHKYLIDERNNFTAHAGNSDSDNFEIRLALKPKNKGKELLGFYNSRDLVYSASQRVVLEHKKLIDHVIDFVDKKLDKIYEKIKKEYESKDIDNLYEEAKTIIIKQYY